MNGAPAKPMRGVAPSSATVRATAAAIGAMSTLSGSGSASICSRLVTGVANTGPRPATISTSSPASLSGTTMSLKKMPASTPCRRTGCRVISAASSGVRQASSIAWPTRSSRYSGSERPAWRMNQTGRVSGRVPRIAASSGESATTPERSGWVGGRASGGISKVSHPVT